MKWKTLLCLLLAIVCAECARRVHRKLGEPRLIYSWIELDFVYPSPEARQADIDAEIFIPENNYIHEVDVYKKEVFVTVPRDFRGVPATLNTVVETPSGPKLKPFPSFETQTAEDCNDLQFLLPLEIDPNTGLVWVADTGRIVNSTDPSKACNAKLIVYSAKTRQEVFRHVFPESVVSKTAGLLDFMVLDYVNGEVGYVYITDLGDSKLVVYDVKNDNSFFIQHPTMLPVPGLPNPVINGIELPLVQGINGIAIDFNFEYVFYGKFPGFEFFQIPTSVLRNGGAGFDAEVRGTGQRDFVANGITLSSKNNMYIADNVENAIRKWPLNRDTPTGSLGDVTFTGAEIIAQDMQTLDFPTGVVINDCGNLWFAAPRFHKFFLDIVDFTGADGTNMHIWRQRLPRREKSYLFKADKRTRSGIRRQKHRH